MARPPLNHDLTGVNCIVTGASSGIGKEIARNLGRMGANVMMGSHDYSRGEEARLELVSDTKNQRMVFCELDLARQVSIRQFVGRFHEMFDRLDILIHNAALWFPTKAESPDGFELVWAANVLGPHLLMKLLRETLKKSAPSRVVFVSCGDAGGLDVDDTDYDRRSYSGDRSYRQSKQAVRLMAGSWSGHLAINGVSVNSCSPKGKFKTNLYRRAGGLGTMMSRLTASHPAAGADTPTYVAVSPDLGGVTGKFFVDRKQAKDKLRRQDDMHALWHLLEHQAGHLNATRTDVIDEEEQARNREAEEKAKLKAAPSASAAFADLFKPPTEKADEPEEEAAEEASDEAEIEVEEEVNVDEASEEDAELAPGEKSGNLFVDRMSSGDEGASFVPALQLQDHSEDKPARPEPEPRKPAKTGEPLYLQYMKNFGKDD